MNVDRRALAHRIGAVAIFAAILGALWLGPIAAYLDILGAGAQQIQAEERVLDRYRTLASAAPPQPAETPNPNSVLLPGVSDAQAVALLQEALQTAAERSAVEIHGLQVLQTDALAGASRIGVRLRATGDIAGLHRLLYAIEDARPLLYPDNLQITTRSLPSGTAQPTLDFQLDVSGFRAEPKT